jgi:hypothetical protein
VTGREERKRVAVVAFVDVAGEIDDPENLVAHWMRQRLGPTN